MQHDRRRAEPLTRCAAGDTRSTQSTAIDGPTGRSKPSTDPGLPCIAEPCRSGDTLPAWDASRALEGGVSRSDRVLAESNAFTRRAGGLEVSGHAEPWIGRLRRSDAIIGMRARQGVEQLAAACATHLLPGAGAGLAAQAGQVVARHVAELRSRHYATNSARGGPHGRRPADARSGGDGRRS
jgi:hypothetical protein